MKYKERMLRDEVQRAVRQYMDGLIQARRQAGGMAVPATQLAVTGRGVTHQDPIAVAQLNVMSSNPNTRLLKSRSQSNAHKIGSTERQLRSKSVPILQQLPEEATTADQRPVTPAYPLAPPDPDKECTLCKPKDDSKPAPDHWIVWRTTPNRFPEKPEQKRPPSAPASVAQRTLTPAPPSRVATPALSLRPVTPADRLLTPIPDEYRNPTPMSLQVSEDLCNAAAGTCDKEPISRPMTAKSRVSRPNTAIKRATTSSVASVRNHTPTPAPTEGEKIEGETTHATHLGQRAVTPKTASNNRVPEIEDWIHNANNYEREVAFKLLKNLNDKKPATPKPAELIRAQQRARGKASAAKHDLYRSAVKPAQHNPSLESQIYQAVSKALARHDQRAIMSQYDYQRNDSGRPRSLHLTNGVRPKAYIHEGSMFTTANGPYKNSFIIHPEWVSEKKPVRKSPQAFNANHYRPVEEHRYSTAMPMYKCN